MSLARGLSTLNTKKPKAKKLTHKDIERLQTEWRQYNKRCRQKNNHKLQFENFDDYVAWTRGQYNPKRKQNKEFVDYAPTEPYVRNTTQYPSLKTSDTIPTGSTAKRESQVYSGERQLLGIATMHKSNMVPVFADNKEQAVEIAQMRRN
jgi:hypothetical protein